MPFQNYYVASDLNNLGSQMQQDRDVYARSQIAEAEQQRLQYQAFMQQLQQRQAQQQQAQQFQQELAFRGQGQNQENAYRNAMLALSQKQQEFSQTGYSPAQEWEQQLREKELAFRGQGQGQENAYRNAMLGLQQKQQEFSQTGYSPAQEWEQQFREKELASRKDIAMLGQNQLGQQALAAMINQQGLTGRDMAVADETWQDDSIASQEKSDMANARAQEIEKKAKRIETDKQGFLPGGWGRDDPVRKKSQADDFRMNQYSELRAMLATDRGPGKISTKFNPDGSYSFSPVRRTRPQGQPQSGYNPTGMNPLILGQPQAGQVQGLDPRQAALIQALQGTQSMTNVNAPSAVVTAPGPQAGYQDEVSQLQASARAGLIDRTTYAQRRREIDAKYGVFGR